MSSHVVQYISAKDIERRRAKVGAPQFSLAHFSEISEGLLSAVLSGRKMLSEEAQSAVVMALNFFEYLTEESAYPVDFGDVAALDRHFREYKKLHSEDSVVRTKSE